MYTLYKDGESLSVDREQVKTMVDAGWSITKPETPVVAEEKPEEKTNTLEPAAPAGEKKEAAPRKIGK